MKSTLVLTTLAAIAASQGIADLPACSLTCLTTAISGLGCGITDFACSCQKASELTPVVTPCVQTACTNPADQSKTIEVLAGICAAAGFPIEVPEPPASTSAVPLPTPEPTAAEPTAAEPSSEAPIETQPSATDEPEYPVYPTATDASDEYPAPTHATDDIPDLPSSHPEVPSHTEVPPVSLPSPSATSIPSILPPYPTGKPSPTVSAPTGTGVPSHTSSGLPEFTGAAAAAQIPVIAAGVFGLAAFVL